MLGSRHAATRKAQAKRKVQAPEEEKFLASFGMTAKGSDELRDDLNILPSIAHALRQEEHGKTFRREPETKNQTANTE
jgi:hypothetical protein